MKPIPKEIRAARWLQKLFKFKTEVSYLIYDYGKRNCTVLIQAFGEKDPIVNSLNSDYGRGPNSIKLLQFARTLPKGENQWYCSGRGFYIPYNRIIELKKRYEKVI